MANENLFYRARLAASRILEPPQERDKILGAIGELARAYEVGPWQLPPDELARQLREQDTWMIQDILNQLNWETLGTYTTDSQAERDRAVNDSARLFKYSPLAQFALWLWTGWGLGDQITVIIRDNPQAQEIWDEFWTADRNHPVIGEDVIHDLSNFLLRDGNTFLAFYTDVTGRSTIRELPTEQITAIVTHPDDGLKALYYKRLDQVKMTEMYYPDWLAYLYGELDEQVRDEQGDLKNVVDVVLPTGAVRMETQREATDVCILHIGHNRKERGSLWGWPLLTCPRAYMSAHRRFSESRLTVAQSVAMFVRRKQVGGGSRAVRSVAGQLASALSRNQLYDTNPPPYAGSVEVENEAVRTTDLPLRTGAFDAKADNELFAWIALLGAGLFPTSAGLDTTRWATALEMDKAQSMLFETYKTFWSAQFTKMVRIVVKMYEKHNQGVKIGDFTVQVSTDTLSMNDVPDIATSVGNLMENALVPLIEPGIIPQGAAKQIVAALWHVVLQAVGVTNADDITSAESFEFDNVQAPVPTLPEPREPVDEIALLSTFGGGDGAGVDTWRYAAIVREMVEDAIAGHAAK